MNAQSNDSKPTKITFSMNPYKIFKLIFNVIDVILKFGSPKRKTHKVHMNNDPCKTFKKYAFGIKKLKNRQNLQLIWTYENMVNF